MESPEQAKGFGPVARAVTGIVLLVGAILVGIAFALQFSPLWNGELNDILVGPTMDDGLRNRQKWAHTVRAAAAMREHCENVLIKARAHIPAILALEPQMRGEKRWIPAVRKAMQARIAQQYEEVRPCESAELFLAFQGNEHGFFPHLIGLGRFFSAAAEAFADKSSASPAELVKRLKDELRHWDRLLACGVESKSRLVLGVVVRPPVWNVAAEQVPAFHGTAADAWIWLAGRSGKKAPTRALTVSRTGGG